MTLGPHTWASGAAAVLALASASLGAELPRLRLGAIGELRVGMSESEVARSAGEAVGHLYPDTEENGCFYGAVRGLPSGTSLMFLDGRLARIDVSEAGVRTVSGAGIGTSERALGRMYGQRLIREPHAYDAPIGHYLTLMSSDGALGLRFETDGSQVTTYYTGTADAIRLKEGCQ